MLLNFILLNSILDADRALALWCGRVLCKKPRIDVEAFKNVLALRAEIEGTWSGRPPPSERCYDLSYSQKALALLDK